ncbi:hypothetical protein [Burkholderia pseudomultivorans]|uniref:hypothetical protein n=1 Tax=Burkholderia pseudomultivorans TaxID=1207504 RepID=UPI00075EEB6A|nr:hypothetical protein [Burkholderia pseudomultivorans]KVG66368.1 hypothetical protein WS80_10430 [Burkholderia pseudomultivorans]
MASIAGVAAARRVSLRAAFQKEALRTAARRTLLTKLPISNVISKNMSVLEIDLEITGALPDKADKPE